MACQIMHTHTYTHAHTVSTYSRHTVTNEHYCKHVDSHARTTTLAHVASTSIPHSLHLSASVTTRGLYSGIPYTAVAKKKKVAWKSFTLSENTTIHLPPSLRSLVAPSLFLFHLLFVSPHFFPSQVFSGAPLRWKTLSFCFLLTYSVTWACGNSEV